MDSDRIKEYERMMDAHGIRPTANRISVMRALHDASHPLSLAELEDQLVTLDKSSIFRVLTLFKEKNLIHAIENGSNAIVYELCLSHSHTTDEDAPVHFFCERCHNTYCLTDILIPSVDLPEGYQMKTANYLIKGICPKCGV